jgi:hypothetical protein
MSYIASCFPAAECKSNHKLTNWRSEVKQTNPMAEDMYEKARGAFFGTAKTSPKPSASSAELLRVQNEPSPKEVTKLSSDKYEAT